MKKAEDRHAKLFLCHRNTIDLKKRYAEDSLASDKTKLVKSYADVSSTPQSVMGVYPSAENQWAAGYGLEAQAWPQAPQTGQQWNPSYAQQVEHPFIIWYLKHDLKHGLESQLVCYGTACMFAY